MERKIVETKDGSHTISIPEMNVTYHSIHGAVQESKYVFIDAGLYHLVHQSTIQPINIFEMGFGSGLNAFLTAIEAETLSMKINYVAVELFPFSIEESKVLNYPEVLQHKDLYEKIHASNWNEAMIISEHFALQKERTDLLNFSTPQQFDLIYYDAFAPAAQPELWTREIFQKLFNMLKLNGVLVTYCSKGDVRRAMIASGFEVAKLPGPPGKREMIRAVKKI